MRRPREEDAWRYVGRIDDHGGERPGIFFQKYLVIFRDQK